MNMMTKVLFSIAIIYKKRKGKDCLKTSRNIGGRRHAKNQIFQHYILHIHTHVRAYAHTCNKISFRSNYLTCKK